MTILAAVTMFAVLVVLLLRLWRMFRGDRHQRNVWTEETPRPLESEYAGPYIAEFHD
jgi:hypothetical protein